jgi:hypothetical protein
MLTVTLDVSGRPPRASVVGPILDNRGKQPLETGMQALGGLPDMVEPTMDVLSAIADLYGVERAYLTDIGSDPRHEEEISERLRERRRDRPRPAYNARLDTTRPLRVIHEPIPEQIDIVNQLARRTVWQIVVWPAGIGLLLLVLAALLAFTTIIIDGGGVRVVLGAVTALIGMFAVRSLLDAGKALRLFKIDRSTFGAAIQAGLREHIALKLHHYMTTTDLPYDFFITTIGNVLPVENGTLDRLARGDKHKKASIVQDAVLAYLSSPAVRDAAARTFTG